MINLMRIVCGELNENCYVVSSKEQKQCLIIDPGNNFEDIKRFVHNNGLKINAILLTHGHFDHIGACENFQKLGVKVFVHKNDFEKCNNPKHNMSFYMSNKTVAFVPDAVFSDDFCKLNFGCFCVNVYHTPGHSSGSCCFKIENFLFVGDTLFEKGYGRTDFYDGSFESLKSSIKFINKICDDKTVLCYGH